MPDNNHDDVNEDLDLTGQMLIAMPGMADPRFANSVVQICAHSSDGAMGLITNKPVPQVAMADLLDKLDIDSKALPANMPDHVYFGGPVEPGRGFVLHYSDYRAEGHTLDVGANLGMTATLDILKDISRGQGPCQALVLLGYAGWGAGQLEQEISQNGWLTGPVAWELIFDTDPDLMWARALESIGIDPLLLSADAGHA